MNVTGTAQHEAWRARALPPVERLQADLWSIPIPMLGPLRYVNVYAFALQGGGLGLLDAGWQSDEGWEALTEGLSGLGADVADVRGVLVTHLHFDHLGLAERVRQASGAWVAMHPADASIVGSPVQRDPRARVAAEIDFLVSLGADREEAITDVGSPERGVAALAIPDRLLEDGAVADFPGWRMRAVHTPGHTPGHLCFAEDRTGFFFSGDHVLPRISPNISTSFYGTADPLDDYMRSLGAVSGSEPTHVLPAHEWRFRGLADRTAELSQHHERRLAELLDAIREHPGSTAWGLAAHLTWSRPWEEYERRMRIFAVTETDAHLRLLESRGLITGSGEAVPTWTSCVR